MELWLESCIAVLAVLVLLLCIRLHLVKKAAREIHAALPEKLNTDTNTPITLSCRDKDLCLLADTLNQSLEQLRAMQHCFEQGNAQLQTAITSISHDLRTPLTMMKAYAEMIRDLSGDNPVKRAEHLNIIIEETDRLALMVNDILDLSKLESGGLALTPSTFGIRAKLSEIIDRYRGLSAKTGYHIHFTPDEETMVTCDAGKIEQVICNLINNAVNYTGPDKQIFVRQINTPNGVRIEVQDTGAGIDKENLRMIFDKYYRSENHKREVVGTGLGLSIVKAIMKLHNYSYGVDSTLGKGSTFWFVIHQDKKEETHHAGTGSH